AIDEFKEVIRLTNDRGAYINNLGDIYAIIGRQAEARRVLAELKELAKHEYVQASDIASIYASLGEKDEAFAWLDKAYDERDVGLLLLKSDAGWDKLRSDARFERLLKRMKLPP